MFVVVAAVAAAAVAAHVVELGESDTWDGHKKSQLCLYFARALPHGLSFSESGSNQVATAVGSMEKKEMKKKMEKKEKRGWVGEKMM